MINGKRLLTNRTCFRTLQTRSVMTATGVMILWTRSMVMLRILPCVSIERTLRINGNTFYIDRNAL